MQGVSGSSPLGSIPKSQARPGFFNAWPSGCGGMKRHETAILRPFLRPFCQDGIDPEPLP
jgi:hypothetical protein